MKASATLLPWIASSDKIEEAKVEFSSIPKCCYSDVSLDTENPPLSQSSETGALPTSQILRPDLSEDRAGDGVGWQRCRIFLGNVFGI